MNKLKLKSFLFLVFVVNCSLLLEITLAKKKCPNDSYIKSKARGFLKSKTRLNSKTTIHDGIELGDNSTPLRLNREELGNKSWNVLHSFAAAFPVKPTELEIANFKNLITSFTVLYPCEDCRNNFKELIENNPIQANNRKEAVMYLCGIHNQVNARIGKEIFDCTKAMEYWGGDCGCTDSSN